MIELAYFFSGLPSRFVLPLAPSPARTVPCDRSIRHFSGLRPAKTKPRAGLPAPGNAS